ncbi:MAG TPA: hypothetical protein VKX41_15815 [Alloacidobacterium sp.]|nr:hypothetical protein [Alloacidobacterium sp.]
MANGQTVYLHFPCFDGVISAVLVSEYLKQKRGWDLENVVPVGYAERETWASRSLEKPAAVVDFLYHPDAEFWADHHQTTFLNQGLKHNFEKRKTVQLFYDPTALSCASVVWRNTHQTIRHQRFREMVDWANRIDGARYESVEQAVLGDAPALRINFSFMRDPSPLYCRYLVDSLRTKSLADVAASREVDERYQSARKELRIGQKQFRKSARLERDGIVVFHVDHSASPSISRYAPYLEFPKALYSIGILNSDDGTKITAMRNPWRHFRSVPLGQIFRNYGGGGHQRVASVLVNSRDAERTLQSILTDLRRARSPKTSLEKDMVTGD